jgi:hypothetical protein
LTPPETQRSNTVTAMLDLLGPAAVGAGNTLRLGSWWTNTGLVRRHPWLT